MQRSVKVPSLKPQDIHVGATYANRNAGTTQRTVIGIGDEHRPKTWLGAGKHPDETGVLFIQNDKKYCLYISSFAKWAGRIVTPKSSDAATVIAAT